MVLGLFGGNELKFASLSNFHQKESLSLMERTLFFLTNNKRINPWIPVRKKIFFSAFFLIFFFSDFVHFRRNDSFFILIRSRGELDKFSGEGASVSSFFFF